MKKIDVGQAITIITNVGVIAGIILLAFELRQSQLVGRSQTRNEIARTALELNQFSATQDVADIVLRSDRGEELTEQEVWQLNFWLDNWMVFWENLHYQYRQGLFDESEFQGDLNQMRYFFNFREALRINYCSGKARGTYSQEFAAEIDALLEEPCD